MNVRPTLRAIPLVFAGLASIVLEASCARSEEDRPYATWAFGTEGAVRDVCVQTECPAPFATCEGERGLCTVDLRSDVDHCGSCGARCPRTNSRTPWSFVCSEGLCRLACDPHYADCNGRVDDGCETSTWEDPANCGGCGNACDEGVLCWRGACGCPNGFTRCGDDCVRLDADNENCGACGSVCEAPESDADPRWTCGPGVEPNHTAWTCASASCSLQCKQPYADCNQDFCGDGCEVDLGKDPANCGACGNACAPGQRCESGACTCPPGTTRCAGACVDLSTDPAHCGECGASCPGSTSARANGGPLCEDGRCSYVCSQGFADCDDDLDDGCEANLLQSQRHCGSCGNRCDVAGGQPCVAGTCLTKPCDEPVVR